MGVLDSMTGVVENNENDRCNENGPVKPPICRFDYPLQINNMGMCMKVSANILDYDEEENPTLGYKLRMNSLHNGRRINSYMRGLIEIRLLILIFNWSLTLIK